MQVDVLADVAFLIISLILTVYSLKAIRFMNSIRYHPTIIKYVTAVGVVASIAAALETTADVYKNDVLAFYHAIGMFLMSALLLLAVRSQLGLLRKWASRPEEAKN